MNSSTMTVPKTFYAVVFGLGLALGLGSYLFGFAREQAYKAEMERFAPSDRIPLISPDGSEWTVGWSEEYEAVRRGFRVEPEYLRLKTQAQKASEFGFAFALSAVAMASILGGLLVYRLLRMVLDRFVQPKWACLISGLLCGASVWLASGLVLGLIELSRLPRVGDKESA